MRKIDAEHRTGDANCVNAGEQGSAEAFPGTWLVTSRGDWANDLCKGTARSDLPRIRAIALTDNVPLITAWANDTAFEYIFHEQLVNFLKPEDVVIGISGSGNSPNVLHAMIYARTQGAQTIGLTGFRGGHLKDLVDLCLIVPSDSMEQIEDIHMIIAHTVSTSLRLMAAERIPATTPVTFPIMNGEK